MSRSTVSRGSVFAVGAISIVAAIAVAVLVLSPAPRRGSSPTASSASLTRQPAAVLLAARQRAHASYAALPLAFEPNQGQTDPQVQYTAQGAGYKLYLTSSQAILTVRKPGEASEVRAMLEHKRLGPAKVKRMQQHQNSRPAQVAVVRMQLLGASSAVQLAAADPQAGKISYFLGNDPSKWHSNIPLFGRVSYRNLYPGVDLAFHGAGGQLEFDYLVSPGADARSIALGFQGAGKISTNAAGDLLLATAAGPVEMHRPVAYQEKDGARQNVEARFELKGANEAAFALGPYDHSRELVIDPAVTYSTYFGGSGADNGLSILADASGDAFVAGATDSATIPGHTGGTDAGSVDVFVTEIAPAGTLVFTSVFGGSGDDFPGFPGAIAIDSTGIYVSGTTDSSDFPVTAGAAQTTFQGGSATNGNNDAFAVKLPLGGGAPIWATYIGGNQSDSGLGIAVDGNQNVYVVGETFSTNLPVKNPLPSGSSLNLGQGTVDDDGYIAVLNSTGSAFTLVSYIGGSDSDNATAVALDGEGNAYVTGDTDSSDLPVTAGVVQGSLKGSGAEDEIFVCSIKASSFSAANSTSTSTAVAQATAPGNVSQAPRGALAMWLPIPALALFGSFWCGADSRRRKRLGMGLLCLALVAFILMPACGGGSSGSGGGGGGGGTTSTSSFVYMTYYGGTGGDEAQAIAVDAAGNAFVTGQTASTDFPVVSAFQATLNGTQNAFVLELNPSGSTAINATYFGGNGIDFGLGIAIDASDNAYLTGQTSSAIFPLAGATQGALAGPTDAFVSVLSSNTLLFSTYLGGTGDEDVLGGSIAVSTAGGIYVTGDTTSVNFPRTNALQGAFGGGSSDGFIASYTAP